MSGPDDDLLDDLFTGCAALAFVEQARQQQDWPDSEATRRRAYRHYEDALADKNRRKSKPEPVDGHRPTLQLYRTIQNPKGATP